MTKVKELKGEYCADCVKSLTQYTLQPGLIVPMCREDLWRFMRNGDMQRVQKMLQTPPGERK